MGIVHSLHLLVVILVVGRTFSYKNIRTVHCDDFVNLHYDDIDLENLTEPLLLRQCNSSDAEFREIISVLGTPKKLKTRYGPMTLNVFPTGPFHLQLGSTLSALKPVGSTTIRDAVNRLGEESFAFGTTRENPGYNIVQDTLRVVSNLQKSTLAAHNGSTIFRDYFRHFHAHIFSMGGKNAGAPFHYHQSAWLYLCAGRKEWILAPYAHQMPVDVMWTSLGKLKQQHDLQELFQSDQVIHAVQHAGDLVLLPSFWIHATNNLDDYTTGLGGQQHPELNDRDPPEMVEYREAFESDDWEAAAKIQKKCMDKHPEDSGSYLRFILMSLRHHDVEAARQTYYTLRDIVYDALQRGIIVENDAYFLLVEQIGACVSDALGRIIAHDEAENGGTLPPTASREFLDTLAFQEEIQVAKLPEVGQLEWKNRIQGGVDKILGPMCYDIPGFHVVHSGANCSTYVKNPALCRMSAECDVHSDVRHCDAMKGLKHTDACCVCGGGRDFSTASQQGTKLAGGDVTAVYMQIRNGHRGGSRRRRTPESKWS